MEAVVPMEEVVQLNHQPMPNHRMAVCAHPYPSTLTLIPLITSLHIVLEQKAHASCTFRRLRQLVMFCLSADEKGRRLQVELSHDIE